MPRQANLDADNYRLESCMRENRLYSSEGGERNLPYPYVRLKGALSER